MIQGIISNLILINSDTHFANDNTFISHFKYQFTRFDTLLNWTLNFAKKKKKKKKNARLGFSKYISKFHSRFNPVEVHESEQIAAAGCR